MLAGLKGGVDSDGPRGARVPCFPHAARSPDLRHRRPAATVRPACRGPAGEAAMGACRRGRSGERRARVSLAAGGAAAAAGRRPRCGCGQQHNRAVCVRHGARTWRGEAEPNHSLSASQQASLRRRTLERAQMMAVRQGERRGVLSGTGLTSSTSGGSGGGPAWRSLPNAVGSSAGGWHPAAVQATGLCCQQTSRRLWIRQQQAASPRLTFGPSTWSLPTAAANRPSPAASTPPVSSNDSQGAHE